MSVGIFLAPAALSCVPSQADTVVLETPLNRGAVILDHDKSSGLGSSVAGIGDFDGDGIPDLAVSARVEKAVYIVPGRHSFPPAFRLSEDGLVTKIHVDFRFNDYLFPAGDVDGDRLSDLYIFDARGPDSRILLLYGSTTLPPEFDDSEIGSTVRGAILRFDGLSFAPLGDFNGDGVRDLALGEWNVDGPLDEQGMVTIVFGKRNWESDVDLAAYVAMGHGVRILGTSRSDKVEGFGFHIASAGDLNGDGLADVIVSDPRYTSAQGDVIGRVHVLLGSGAFPPLLSADDLGQWGLTIENTETGRSILKVGTVFGDGDLDGDGLSEAGFSILDSAPFGPLRGRVYIVQGRADFPRKLSFKDLEEGRFGFVLQPPEGVERLLFGLVVQFVPDEDGDGRDELLFGRPTKDLNDIVIRGSFPVPAESLDLPLHTFIPPRDEEVFVEHRTQAMAGDINGDGTSDYIISFSKADLPDQREGRIFLVFGGFDKENLSIHRVSPASAPVRSRVEVTVTGTGYAEGMRLLFGQSESDSVKVLDPHTLVATTPAVTDPASVALVVVHPDGRRAELPAGFTFRGGQSLSVGDLAGRITVFRASRKFLTPATLGDINGDGIEDYAFWGREKDRFIGSTYLVYGGTRWEPEVDEARLAEKSVAFVGSPVPPVLEALGDLDGDALADYSATFDQATDGVVVAVIFAPFPPGSNVTLSELMTNPVVTNLLSMEPISGLRPGRFIRSLGDFDGDGALDLLVETPKTVALVRGPITRGLQLSLDSDERVVRLSAEPDTIISGAPIGDFNGDGRSDFIFNLDPRRVFGLVLGHEPAGSQIEFSALVSQGLAYELPYSNLKNGGAFGEPAGDLNGDGFDDVLVNIDDSEVGVLFGREDPLLDTTWEKEAAGKGGFVVRREAKFEDFGYDADLGDVDGDGVPDLVIGSPKFLGALGGAVPGVVYIISGADSLHGSQPLEGVNRPVSVLKGFAPDDRLGYTVRVLGDQDGDHLSEILVEAPFLGFGSEGPNGFACLIPGAALETLPQRFLRGDANADGKLDLSDAVFTLSFLFLGGREPECKKSADIMDSGSINISDPVALLNFLFLSGPEPARPYPNCGADPTADTLGCASFEPCR